MTKPIYPHEIRSFAGMDELVELALDLRWSWDHGADEHLAPAGPGIVGPHPQSLGHSSNHCAGEVERTWPRSTNFSTRVETLAKKMRDSLTHPRGFKRRRPRRR